MKTICTICRSESKDELRHLSIYANGSEGVNACLPCQLAITDYVRDLQSVASRAIMAFEKQRRLQATKEKSNG